MNTIWKVYDICTASEYYFTQKPSLKQILNVISTDKSEYDDNDEDDPRRFDIIKIKVKDNKK